MSSSTNTTKKATRTQLASLTRDLLLGPLTDKEQLENVPPESGPADFYLTGILWPKNSEQAPEDDDGLELDEEAGADGGDSEPSVPLYSVFKPSSLGLTCTIKGNLSDFVIVLKGARYHTATEPERGGTEAEGKKKTREPRNWSRVPFEYTVQVPGTEKRPSWKQNDFIDVSGNSLTDSHITLHVKRRARGDCLIVTASMINSIPDDGSDWNSRCIFQSSVEIKAKGNSGEGKIVARPASTVPGEEDLGNELLYRNYNEYAVGHGVSAVWPKPENFRVKSVKTDWIPLQEVSAVSADGHETLQGLKKQDKSPLSAEFLSGHTDKKEVTEKLEEFCVVYGKWIEEEAKRIPRLPDHLQRIAGDNLKDCRKALERMLDGVKLIGDTKDNSVFRAFQLANNVMDLQSRRSCLGERARPLVWRPFQLGFFLLSIGSVAEPERPERMCMDLLWFPTGGGKTEAYLGLIAFTIFLRRLRDPASRHCGHVDVLMRYTLRLLTVQQFQRAAAMICVADQTRKENPEELGNTPISIGLYVGQQATPNRLLAKGEEDKGSAEYALAQERSGASMASTPRLLLECPLCGERLTPHEYKVINAGASRMEICCANIDCESEGKPLPIHTVDDEIYRAKPSLLLGTVDKFAQLPRNEKVGKLLRDSGTPPPEMIIQDELHLISGPLGTMTGLYETCLDHLCTRDEIKPKIIGSTATIGRATQQVRALFDREVLQFPPPAIDANSSFFAVLAESDPDRIYLGLASSGRSAKFALQAVTAALMCVAHHLEEGGADLGDVDPYWTSLLYFNSLRELGGAKVMMRDDVPRSIRFYANRLGCSERILENEVELTSRKSSNEIPQILNELNLTKEEEDPFKGGVVDMALASNMISVGVDIPRLGLMIVNGQPKATSEFIQATSRVGRGIPGLVMTVYNAGRPRDVSHFEHFKSYHQALYRKVEPTSVTPWSSRARDKALHGVFAAMVRYQSPGMSERFDAIKFDPLRNNVSKLVNYIVDRADGAGLLHASGQDTRNDLEQIIDKWSDRVRRATQSGKKLEYWATIQPFKNTPSNPHLMRSAEESFDDPEVWPTPNSMREVEPSALYIVKERTKPSESDK